MSDVIIQVENLSKQYRLGEVSTGTLSHDLNRWWHRVRGRPDPYLKVTQANIRDKKSEKLKNGKSEMGSPVSAFQRFSVSASSSDYVWALQGVQFEVSRGEVLGIIGRNGAGKSTLLKILSRVTAPTEGEIRIDGRIASLLEVGTGFHPDLTGRENIFLNGAILGMTQAEIKGRLDEIAEFSGCARYLDTPVKRYSSGMIVRLGFAVAAHLEPDILIVDEVLAVGDAEFQHKCVGKMQEVARHGRTVLFVSHNMAAVERLCTRALRLEAGRIVQQGPPAACIEAYLAGHGEGPGDAYRDLSGGTLALRRFCLCTAGRAVSEIYQDGKELEFELEVAAARPFEHFAVHIGLYSHLGAFLCLCRSDAENVWTLPAGTSRLRCSLGTLPLASGAYYCNVVLLEKSQPVGVGARHLWFRIESASPQAASTGRVPPLLAPAARWRQL